MENSTLYLCSDLSGSRSQLFLHRSRGEMQPVGLFSRQSPGVPRQFIKQLGGSWAPCSLKTSYVGLQGVTLGTTEDRALLAQIFGFSKLLRSFSCDNLRNLFQFLCLTAPLYSLEYTRPDVCIIFSLIDRKRSTRIC